MIDKWTKIKNGFTLIELIIVIAILGILVLLAAPNFLGKTQDAEHVKIMAESKSIEDASVMYHLENEDWPRLTDDPYTADELELFASNFSDKTGEEITLDPNGNYYNIDYDELSQYIKAPDNKKDYILQNPVGKIFHMENLTEVGENRVDYEIVADEPEEPVEETLYEFTTADFTTAGATGRLGPTQEDLDVAYVGTDIEGQIISDNGIQLWTVPKSGTYRIETYGAQGGKGANSAGKQGGKGANIAGTFTLSKGTTLNIVVGQEGLQGLGNANCNASGGGGSFVYEGGIGSDGLLMAAGGGGGGSSANYVSNVLGDANVSENGNSAYGLYAGKGGLSGQGGSGGTDSRTYAGGGGSGWESPGGNGNSTSGGNQWEGGNNIAHNSVGGGFGGGGDVGDNRINYHHGAGGGGGYSGGGGSHYTGGGGGAGSYNSGDNQDNSVGNIGNGKVNITYLVE